MPESACPDDEQLLPLALGEAGPPELQAHVAACTACAARVESLRSTTDILRQAAASPAEESVWQRAPGTIANYLMIGTLWEDHESKLYRALHPALNKEVYIRLLRTPLPESNHKTSIDCARRWARLDHPNVLRVLDLAFVEDQPALILEHVPGSLLSSLLKQSLPPATEAASIVAQLARTLSVLHAEDLAVGILEPSTILIDDSGFPRHVGIAIPEATEASLESPADDVHKLGKLLYLLLCGQEWSAGSKNEANTALASQPKQLLDICFKALSDKPQTCFATADEMAAALESYAKSSGRWTWWLAIGIFACVAITALVAWLLR